MFNAGTIELAQNHRMVGCRVRCYTAGGSSMGIVKYHGPTMFGDGEWVGVALDTRTGRNDGSVSGVKYFEAGGKERGVFVR